MIIQINYLWKGVEIAYLKLRTVIALLVTIIMAAACQKEKASQGFPRGASSSGAERVVFRVQQKEFTEEDFDVYLKKQTGKGKRELSAPVLSRLLDQFMEEKFLLEAARLEGISVSEEEKGAYRRKFLADNPVLEEASVQEIDLEEKLVRAKYIEKLISDVAISEEEVLDYYNQHRREFLLPERVKVSQILVDSEAKAVQLKEKLKKNGEALFRQLAKENSLGPEASKGGEMGVFGLNELPDEIEKVIFSLSEGELSPVVESPYGFHIFRLDQRLEPRLLSLEEAAPRIRAKLLEKKSQELLTQHLQELKSKLVWSFFPERLSFPYKKEDQ